MEAGPSPLLPELFCRRFSLAEIESATQNFDETLVIGRGGFGKVYKGPINNGSNTIIVAFKRLHSMSNQGAPEFRAEVEMLSKLRHSHLVSLIGYCNDGKEMVLVYEYMPHGTLEDLLHKAGPPLSWLQRLKICVGAARGLDYLHTGTGTRQGVIHRDVKSSNILLDEYFAAKISDFGLAKISPTNQTRTHVSTGVKGTFGYMDPSYFYSGKLTRKSDVYSFGVVLLEVSCGRPAVDTSLDEYNCGLAPWAQDRIKEGKLSQIIDPRLKGQISSNSLKEFTSIACDCLHYLPNKRPSMAEIVVRLELVLSLQERTNLSAPEGNFIGKVRAYFSAKVPLKVNNLVSSDNQGEPSGKNNDKLADAVVTIGEAKAALGHKKNQQLIPFSFTPIDDAVIERNGVSSASDEMTRMNFNQPDNRNQLVLVLPAMENLKFPSENFLKDFYIPDYILVPGGKVEVLSEPPVCPTIVFINSRSGGQMGGNLLVTCRSILNKNQVFDLGEETPDKVLSRLYLTLENLKLNGDLIAPKIQKQLRIIVAGGDGTAGWLLGVVCDLKFSHPPPIATMPLGAGNNLSFAFGWGKKNPGTDGQSVLHFLEQVKKSKEMEIDSWHILMRMKAAPKEASCDPIAPLELPHSLHRFSSTDAHNMSGYDTYRGGFWNYFSMGMDAQVSYAFHSERKLHPEKFKNQLANQSTYAKLTQGWFAPSLFHPISSNIAQLAKVKIMQRHGGWKDLNIHRSIRSIVCLNLPSFSGGLNPWGMPNQNEARDRDLTRPYVDDGLLEIVGFRDAWHELVLLAPKGHGTRLAQTHRVRFEFHKGAAECTYMCIDGEPWKQPLPVDDDTVVVEITHLGRVKMLATHNCVSKSVEDPSSSHDSEENEADSDEEDETFRISDDVDFSQLS